MSLQNNPIVNQMPPQKRRLSSALKGVLDAFQIDHEQMIPAQIVSYNRAINQATVQPMVMYVGADDSTQSRNTISNVPCLSLGGGGFHVSFPLKQGDFGWLLASDRDISNFLQSMQNSPPNTYRMHKFTDSLFVPDVIRNYTINSSDASAMVIQSTDGTTRISISEGTINVYGPTALNFYTPLASFSQNVAVGGNLTVTGNTVVNGGLNANGSSGGIVSLPANTTVNGIVVATHGHISSTAGTRTSGNMIS
jgi:hypothetical protein